MTVLSRQAEKDPTRPEAGLRDSEGGSAWPKMSAGYKISAKPRAEAAPLGEGSHKLDRKTSWPRAFSEHPLGPGV